MDLGDLENKQRQYEHSLAYVKATLSSLGNSIQKLESLIAVQAQCYSVNDVKGGSNFLNDLLDKEKYIYGLINNDIIPSLSNYLRDLGELIDNTRALEEGM